MTDTDFRNIFVVIVLTTAPLMMYHRIRSDSGEHLDRWQEGAFILFGLRLGAIPFAISALCWTIRPSWMNWSSIPIPDWLRCVGLAMTASGAVLILWTFRHLGSNLTDTVAVREKHTLITSGPYRFVRHPFYLAYLLGFVGFGIASANWLLLITGTIPFCFLVARTPIEERKLVERFGDEYRQYMANTARFIPTVFGKTLNGQKKE